MNEGFLAFSQRTSFDYLIREALNDPVKEEYLKGISAGCYDAQPDIFYFNALGYSGKFQFDWDGNLIVDSKFPITVKPIWSNGFNSTLNGWEVKAPNGVTMVFTAAENTELIADGSNCYISPFTRYNSSWFLTSVYNANTSASDRRFIRFDYEDYTIRDYEVNFSASRRHSLPGQSKSCGGSFVGTTSISNTLITIKGKRLKRVYSSNSPIEVVLQPGSVRTDLSGEDLYELSSIEMRKHGRVFKSFELLHDQSTGRLTLNSLQEIANSTSVPAYKFYYHDRLPDRATNAKDRWGYYNNSGSMDHFPRYFIPHSTGLQAFGSANRDPDFKGSRSGVLYKIEYPTGGSDHYTYELNDYSYIGSQQIHEYETQKESYHIASNGNTEVGTFGGAQQTDVNTRLFTINPEQGNPQYKAIVDVSFHLDVYSESYFGAGLAPKARILDSEGNVKFDGIRLGEAQKRLLTLAPGDYTLETQATWKQVTNDGSKNFRDRAYIKVEFDNKLTTLKKKKDTGGVRVSKIEKKDANGDILMSIQYDYSTSDGLSTGVIFSEPKYTYRTTNFRCAQGTTLPCAVDVPCRFIIALSSSRSDLGATQGNHFGYQSITSTAGDGTTGKTIKYYTVAYPTIFDEPPFPPSVDRSYRSGLLTKVEVFNDNNELVEESSHDYKVTSQLIRALKVNHKGGQSQDKNFDKGLHFTLLGHAQQQSVTTKRFDLNGVNHQESRSETVYDELLQNVIEQKQFVNGKIRKAWSFYAQDVINPVHAGIRQMNEYHMSSIPIEIVNVVEEAGQEYVIGAVYYDFDHLLNLKAVYTYKGVGKIPVADFLLAIDNQGRKNSLYHQEPEIVLSWDAQKNVKDHVSDGVRTSYLYDSRNFPIATITGAQQGEVFYEGFEEVTSATTGAARTGDRYHNYGTFNFATQGDFSLPSSTEFVMSYWYLEDNQWEFSGEVPFQNLINKGEALDEIRAYRKGTLMTTYTHRYGYGISSVTDPNGISQYYIYDDLGRLIQQKDQDGHTLQEYEYHYGN